MKKMKLTSEIWSPVYLESIDSDIEIELSEKDYDFTIKATKQFYNAQRIIQKAINARKPK